MRTLRIVTTAAAVTLLAGAVLASSGGDPAWALDSALDWAQGEEPYTVDDLDGVVTNIRNWLVGLLVALATLLLTIGGVRYVLAGGDPGEVSRAKDTLKYAALGYLVALLAPLLVEILRGFVETS
jgi:hypothetical protein